MLIMTQDSPFMTVMHLILEPESETLMDVNGAVICDISKEILAWDRTKPIAVYVTRARSETGTYSMLAATKTNVRSSFEPQTCDGECEKCDLKELHTSHSKGETWKKNVTTAATSVKTIELKEGVCTYCGAATMLLPIPGIQICYSCTVIELKRGKNASGVGTTTESDIGTSARSAKRVRKTE